MKQWRAVHEIACIESMMDVHRNLVSTAAPRVLVRPDFAPGPSYQRDVRRELARRHHTSIDAVLTREPEEVGSATAEELAPVLPRFAAALAWPSVNLVETSLGTLR